MSNGFSSSSSVLLEEPECPSLEDCTRETADCAWIFGNIRVWPIIEGGSRVEWTMHSSFSDAGPYVYQLQAGRTGSNDADDWVNIGLPVTNACYAIDPEKRVYGKSQWTHYRLLLTTADGTYTSAPQPATGVLAKQDRLLAREIERKELLRLKKGAGQFGYLLKRRLFGTACSCRDYITEETTNPACELCYGTGFTGGYFEPVDYWAELTQRKHRNHIEDPRGTVDDSPRARLRGLNSPQVFSYDVWVDKDTDFRWIIHEVSHLVEVRGVPIIIGAEARLAPFSDVVYKFPVPGVGHS